MNYNLSLRELCNKKVFIWMFIWMLEIGKTDNFCS